MATALHLCECGCGTPTDIARRTQLDRGHRKGEPFRFARGHTPKRPLSAKWEVVESGCWEWRRATSPSGYGQIYANGRLHRAHRYVYETLVGPIPEGLQLDHLCRVRHCVNPSHLEPVTQRENTLRGESVTAQCARKTSCPLGHPYDEANTYFLANGHRRCLICKRAQGRATQARLVERRRAR